MRRILLAIILLELPLQLDKYFYRDELLAAQGALSGLNISLTTICLVLLYALSLPSMLVRTPYGGAPSLRAGLPLFTYLGVTMCSVVVAADTTLAFFEIFLLIQTFLLFLYVIHWVRTENDVLFVVSVLLLGVVLQGMLMIAVKIIGHDFGFGTIMARVGEHGRAEGTIGSPNEAAAYLTLLLVPAMGLLVTPVAWRYKLLSSAALVMGTIGLLLTYSRGGWVAFVVSCGVFCLLAWQRGRLSWKLPALLTTLVVVLFLSNQEASADRLLGDDGGAAASRLPLVDMALMMIADHPIIGVGVNNCAVVTGDYTNTVSLRSAWLYVIHNKYLLVWVETGILGLAAFLWFLAATLRRGWLTWRMDDRFLAPLGLAFAAAMLGQMVHMSVDVFHSRIPVQTFWLIAAIIVAIYNVSRDKAIESEDQP